MRKEIKSYLWICDDCDKETIMIRTLEFPEGWEEVDDGPTGECQDVCEECVKNHTV